MKKYVECTIDQTLLPTIAVLLVWLFVFDTVFTFIRRIFRGEKVWEAHRGHVYQRLIIEGFSHRAVTVLYGLLSTLIALTTGLWVINKGVWEMVLIFTIGFQTIALLFYLQFIQKRKHRFSNQNND